MLLVAVPAIFVVAAAEVLQDFAGALGGSLAGDAASTLGAGWAAAFIAGTLGLFQATSSRGADRRLALTGLGPARVAASRITASLMLAVIAASAGLLALLARTGIAHPWHAAVAVLAFAVIYLAIGILVGSLIDDPLEGSLAVTFIFLLDVFSGPGMTAEAAPYSVSRKAADVLLTAGLGGRTDTSAWVGLALITFGALAAASGAFVLASRSRA
ncbi:hypothetical protein GKE82_04925 [Conexibacter sp. W3-3-2]|uniref:hypothetical protein n=1 Tax=Conexibacter sp. W3-3-2 TaxID=2675227 RepID=UPI0012B88B60|nr:hypothetical protein [Conexibacter sp. W3-3-2]MTD43664.1 hypothetical protein [Conexibacter sp. W3-3-2]